MNKYARSFLHRGLIFAGLGPILLSLVFFFISISNEDIVFTGSQILLAIISTYVLAFIQAGSSVFNQIEHWSVAKSLFWHFGSIYLTYVSCYLVNSWIPFDWIFLMVFTASFAIIYFVIWITVFLSVKTAEKHLNKKIR